MGALVAWSAGAVLYAQNIVVPNSLTEQDGNSSETSPSGPTGALRWMNVYDASEFGGLSGPALLTQFAWRGDASPGPWGPRTATFRIYASTTQRPLNQLSTTFAENLGADHVLLFSGTQTHYSSGDQGPGNTRQFDFVTPLTTPYLYDPAAGNLVIDFQVLSASGGAVSYDEVSESPTVRQVFVFGSTTAATGSEGIPPVTQFTFQPAPQATIRLSQAEICWNSLTNVNYQVQFRSPITADAWTSLADCVAGTGGRLCISDFIEVGQPEKFYRVVVTNCVASP